MITRCARCLLPSTYPGVSFDSDGVCNYCLDYSEPRPIGEGEFLEKIRSKPRGQYDCVLGISGGKDSCYVAYLAKKLDLHTLAVCYDFPFMVDLARENVRTVCDRLEIDLLVVQSRNNFEYDLLRNHLISLAATGTTWGQCTFCHYGIDAVLWEAAQSRGVPFILSGVTDSEVWWNPGNRLTFLANRLKDLPLSEKAQFGFFQTKAYLRLVDQRRQFPMPGNSCLDVYRKPRAPSHGPETIRVFHYFEWDQETIEQTLEEETGWKKPPRSLSWRYDCLLEPLLDFTYMKEFGISSAGLYLCGLIRAGVLSREEALHAMEECEAQERLDSSLKTVLDFLAIAMPVQEKFVTTFER